MGMRVQYVDFNVHDTSDIDHKFSSVSDIESADFFGYIYSAKTAIGCGCRKSVQYIVVSGI